MYAPIQSAHSLYYECTSNRIVDISSFCKIPSILKIIYLECLTDSRNFSTNSYTWCCYDLLLAEDVYNVW